MIHRLSLHPTAPAVMRLEPDETARVSLAWWDDDGRDPVLAQGPVSLPCTVVIRWPTDHAGRVDLDALARGEIRAERWDLGHVALDALRWVSERWPLREHDVLVSGSGVVVPTLRTLRTREYGVDLGAVVRRVVDGLGEVAA
jgi:hypothetical protein